MDAFPSPPVKEEKKAKASLLKRLSTSNKDVLMGKKRSNSLSDGSSGAGDDPTSASSQVEIDIFGEKSKGGGGGGEKLKKKEELKMLRLELSRINAKLEKQSGRFDSLQTLIERDHQILDSIVTADKEQLFILDSTIPCWSQCVII